MAGKNKAGNRAPSSDPKPPVDLGPFVDKHNRVMTIGAGIGVVIAVVAAVTSYQMGKSGASQEAETKGYEAGIAQGLKSVEEGNVSEIEEKFAKVLREAEMAAEKRGFEKGFAEGERIGLEKGKKLSNQEQ
ncbi:MAG: hypothetical protein ACR2OR_12705 [Hyphomicrobiales bacterium]